MTNYNLNYGWSNSKKKKSILAMNYIIRIMVFIVDI
jgi:hypothetical protein